MRRKLFTLRNRPCCRGGGAAATSGDLACSGQSGGGAEKKGPTYAPPPFVPSARKTFFLRRSPLKSRRRLSQKKKFCKVRPLRPPLPPPLPHDAAILGRPDIRAAAALSCYMGLYLVGQISERRQLYRPQPPPHTTKDAVAHSAERVKGTGAKRPAASGALDTTCRVCIALLVWCVGGNVLSTDSPTKV